MEYFPAPLEALVEQFARLPGIGGKTAQRLAFHVLGLPAAGGPGLCRRHRHRQENRHLLPGVPQLHRRGAVSHLRLRPGGTAP